MEYKKDTIFNTKLPILIIKKNKKYHDYPQIGFGDEGSIHRFNDRIAFKTFDFTKEKLKLPKKFEKIEELGKLKDDNACFPIGLVGYEDEKKEGYYCELVHKNEEYKNFDYLIFLKDIKRKIQYMKQASDALKRLHKKGLIIGDIKGNNTLIDQNDIIKFVDTDNWKYQGFDYDLEPGRASWLKRIYSKDFKEEDNDKFVFALMALQTFICGAIIDRCPCDNYFDTMIDCLNLRKSEKVALRSIFSDSNDKPYIGDVLKEIDPEEGLIDQDNIYRLNRYIKIL